MPNTPATFWFILDDDQPQDGEFYTTREAMLKSLNYAHSGVRVGYFDQAEFMQGRAIIRSDETLEDLVADGYHLGLIDGGSKIYQQVIGDEPAWVDPNAEHRTWNRGQSL
ncbi:hypothetical protein PSQ19_06185 [Devosia algicola]|uniref:Uncharacterized protein n=1 Tax=Devosia algicola TaxID=3026418 RepID=A0ABY7YQU4_9HYPH|nr:hypothetical protein [Devosia algicola]WDR03656.1 hypothetical protein PSQ19_06185 [Devosia algicola]